MHVKRFLAMILLLLGGAGSLLYGSLFHVTTVEVEKQREISIAVPTTPGPEGFPSGEIDPFLAPPGIRMETAVENYVEAQEEPEWAIVWEVTFGGVTRLANGQLKRTYSGKPPALCPT